MTSFERMLESVGGKQGIIDCLKLNNDAPLDIVLDSARVEIKTLKDELELISGWDEEAVDEDPEGWDVVRANAMNLIKEKK